MKAIVAFLAIILAGLPANAAPLRYHLSGDVSFSFVLDDHALPNRFVSGAETDFYDVAGNFGELDHSDVYLFTSDNGGGIVLNDFDGGTGAFLNATGAQLFSGLTKTPVLLKGEFDLTGVSGGRFHLSVASVPEAQTWMLMLAGFGAVAWILRRQRNFAFSGAA